jgi:ParB-like chromosome segregation protein Spo0J
MEEIKNLIGQLLAGKGLDESIGIINDLREYIHELSPFKNEPVDFVKWVVSEKVVANDYNPNKVAPPEMELLEISIINDGYTQPIVTWPREDEIIEVIDGFHRNRVGRESKLVNERIKGYLPTVIIRKEQSEKNDRIASTIRHNRARGKHVISAMADIVIELKRRNWSDERVAKELGMDADEVLRLCQITGLAEAFENEDFSEAWVSEIFDENYEGINFEQNDSEDLS